MGARWGGRGGAPGRRIWLFSPSGMLGLWGGRVGQGIGRHGGLSGRGTGAGIWALRGLMMGVAGTHFCVLVGDLVLGMRVILGGLVGCAHLGVWGVRGRLGGGRGSGMGPQLAQKARGLCLNWVQDPGEGSGAFHDEAGHACSMQACRVLGLLGCCARQPVKLAEAEKRLALHRQPVLLGGHWRISRVLRQSGGLPLARPSRPPPPSRGRGGPSRSWGRQPPRHQLPP